MGMNNTQQNRAGKGGEIGANGEFYKGGAFIANTDRPKMAKRKAGGRKQIIAPFQWEVAPNENLKSLFQQFRDFINLNTGIVNIEACRHYNRNPEEIADMYVQWCDGERWMIA